MKKKIVLIVKILAIAGLLTGIAFLIKDSSDQLTAGGYSASSSTHVKFDKMKRWLPENAELIVVVDPHRLFANDVERERIVEWIEQGKSFAGMSAKLIAHLVVNPGAVGLVAAGAKLTTGAQPAEGLLIVQGALDAQAMTAEISNRMAAEGVELSRGECRGIPLYVESSSPDAFALAFPDKQHMLLGTMKMVEEVMSCDEGVQAATQADVSWYPEDDSRAAFGRLMVTPRLRTIFPEDLRGIQGIPFSMGSDFVLHAEVPCTSTEQAHRAQLFFEGVRASLVVASMDKPELSGFLLNARMTVSPNSLRIAIPLAD